jgi:hypothetical protein
MGQMLPFPKAVESLYPAEFDAQFDARFASGRIFEPSQAHNAGANGANLS